MRRANPGPLTAITHSESQSSRVSWKRIQTTQCPPASTAGRDLPSWSCRFDPGHPLHYVGPGQSRVRYWPTESNTTSQRPACPVRAQNGATPPPEACRPGHLRWPGHARRSGASRSTPPAYWRAPSGPSAHAYWHAPTPPRSGCRMPQVVEVQLSRHPRRRLCPLPDRREIATQRGRPVQAHEHPPIRA
jgi:hypothetical protein